MGVCVWSSFFSCWGVGRVSFNHHQPIMQCFSQVLACQYCVRIVWHLNDPGSEILLSLITVNKELLGRIKYLHLNSTEKQNLLNTQQQWLYSEIMTQFLKIIHRPCEQFNGGTIVFIKLHLLTAAQNVTRISSGKNSLWQRGMEKIMTSSLEELQR